MQALKAIQTIFPGKVAYPIFDKIGDGADGDVYLTTDDNVIKFSILYDLPERYDLDLKILKVISNLKMIKDDSPQHFAKIININYIGQSSRATVDGEQKFHLYYYVLERAYKLSEDEKKVFHTLFPQEWDNNKTYPTNSFEAEKIIKDLSKYLDFDADKVNMFYTLAVTSKFHHNDPNVNNIMKDKDGNFKFIDFDRIKVKK